MTDRPARGATFFGEPGVAGFTHRAFTKSMGYDDEDLARPVIGIANTFSELNNCHRHFRELCEAVKRGVWQAGGTPLEFPTISLGEIYLSPTSMLHRNLAAMDTEEMIRAQPLDGVVLLASCDKTTPAALMGAASADVPAILVSGGPMLDGHHRGQTLGACTDCRRLTAEHRAGELDDATYAEIEDGIVRSAGHCMVMGTASTMNSLAEALGMQLPGSATWPAVDARRFETAQDAGNRIVTMVEEDQRPSSIMTREAFENAIRTNAAIGGSTNAIIHLTAIAGRLGVPLELDDFDGLARPVPTLVNLMPSGKYLMEDFCYAGGIPVVMKDLLDAGLLHGGHVTVTGRALSDNVADAECWNRDVITPVDDPFQPAGTGTAVLRGNLAPAGAVIKQSAASPHLMSHTGTAVVFDSPEDYHAISDDPDCPIDENNVIVVRNSGPKGYPGMPEVSNVPLPTKLLSRGITDMVRICDGRMSGTSYGTVVLHVSPESAVGGPLALVRTGDSVTLDVANRSLTLEVSDDELERRRTEWTPPEPPHTSGYGWLYVEHVEQADKGADFDFLRGNRGHAVPRESH